MLSVWLARPGPGSESRCQQVQREACHDPVRWGGGSRRREHAVTGTSFHLAVGVGQ